MSEVLPGGQLTLKGIDEAADLSVQARARREDKWGFALLNFLAQGAGLVSPWWSKQRDLELNDFWKKIPHLSGAFYTLASKLSAVPFRIEPRDPAVRAHRDLADQFQGVLEEEAEFGQMWEGFFVPWLLDLWTQDNGAFAEVIGEGSKDGPIRGPAVGLAHLDSYRCNRTGNADFPVVYIGMDGTPYKLHRSRVVYASQMPSPREEMYRVGLCWTSRVLDVAQNLLDILTFKQEKLGSRPARRLMITQGGLDPDTLKSAFEQAEQAMTNQGLTRYAKTVITGDQIYPDANVASIDLAGLPDGFDEQQSITLGMFTIALTGAVPPRWLWPASETGATKADAMYQHVAGLTGGPGATLKLIATALGGSERGKLSTAGKFLPPTLRMTFDFQDDEEDRTQAEIRFTRSQQREKDLADEVITVRVAREQAVEAGDLTKAQFEMMELEDGRLEDGSETLDLFYSRDPQIAGMLTLDARYEDALDTEANDAVEMAGAIEKQIRLCRQVVMIGPNASIKAKARQCQAALEALGELYKPQPEPPQEEPLEPGQSTNGSERLPNVGEGGGEDVMVGADHAGGVPGGDAGGAGERVAAGVVRGGGRNGSEARRTNGRGAPRNPGAD